MLKNKGLKLLFFVFFFITALGISFSDSCLDVKVVPVKDTVKISKNDSLDYVDFNLIFENKCNKSFDKLTVIYRDFVYSIYPNPEYFSLKPGEEKSVDVKIFVPNYLSTGWKAVKLEVLDKENNEILRPVYVKFYLENPHYKVVEKVKYIYLKLLENLDLLINIPPKVKCGLNKEYNFSLFVKNLKLSDLENSSFELVIFAKNTNDGKNLPLEWRYLNKINKSLIEETDKGLIFKNKIYANFSVEPGFYTIEAILMIRKGKDYDVSEEAKTNLYVEGAPYFIVKEQTDKGLLSSKKIIKVTNIGNKEGVYELSIPVNWFKKMFMEYNFEAKIENNHLVTQVKLEPKESKTFTIIYDYSPIVITLLVLAVFGFIYYYFNYKKPFTFRKDITKIHIGKNKKSFFIEVTIKNNSFKKMKDIVIIEKVQNGSVDELAVYPKPDRIKKDLTGSSVRWEIKEFRPQQKVKLLYKVVVEKNKAVVTSQPTILKVNGKIYLGKGLKIYVGDEIKFEEY